MKIITRKEAKAQGLKRYFTGKPCKRGHVSERHVSDGKCWECSRRWRAENPEYGRQYSRRWREENREYVRQWSEENRDKLLEKQRQYYAENREEILERSRQWREENRERKLEYVRQYRDENRELYAAYVAKRRAAKIDRTLSHKEELTQFVMEEAAQQAKDMEELFGMPFHVDHMIPMRGEEVSGLHVWYNLQVIPAHLNFSKGNRMRYTQPLEWISDAT